MDSLLPNFLFRSSNILALDIGSRYIKVMQLDQSDGMPTLCGTAIGPVPPRTIENGVIMNKPAVASAIRRLLESSKINGSQVYLAAGGPNLILRWIEMPAMAEEDLLEAIKFEARKYLPFPVEHAVLDCQILNKKNNNTDERLRVLLIAAPRTLVDSRYETVELAGLKPMGMDVEPLAVLRALEHNSSRAELAWGGHPQAVLVFGSAGTDFYVAKDANLEFARRIPIGGRTLVDIIAKHSGQNLDIMDEREILLHLSFDSDGKLQVEGASEELMQALESEIGRLDQEIKRSCSYYQSLFPEGSYEGVLTQVVASGGLVAMEGFHTHLAVELDLPVEVADPLSRITMRSIPNADELLNGRRSSFIVSAGLLLGQVNL